MGGVSIWHWIVVGVVVMLLFGRGKVSELMGDVAKGIKAFKKGMSDEETAEAEKSTVSAKAIESHAADPATASPVERKVG
ncbi:twin-arginine translocase TatA/TatE family subunit [Alsobacter sp. SYSU M60028]|uniref:Sec-independent protein translocase protein TatA n=1 Tax=Alsobacter ponti TaxID=2962936 RepID=A0ABT1LD09_9HYPH|nr:twin-arginine translocase TatA/TatE family subunit [Alsobacter ponti]MCP8939349.1 twin-arginine translocase TatA/TatE family subunit [Alsobacter ponti]